MWHSPPARPARRPRALAVSSMHYRCAPEAELALSSEPRLPPDPRRNATPACSLHSPPRAETPGRRPGNFLREPHARQTGSPHAQPKRQGAGPRPQRPSARAARPVAPRAARRRASHAGHAGQRPGGLGADPALIAGTRPGAAGGAPRGRSKRRAPRRGPLGRAPSGDVRRPRCTPTQPRGPRARPIPRRPGTRGLEPRPRRPPPCPDRRRGRAGRSGPRAPVFAWKQ
jgi:hypothetical protein